MLSAIPPADPAEDTAPRTWMTFSSDVNTTTHDLDFNVPGFKDPLRRHIAYNLLAGAVAGRREVAALQGMVARLQGETLRRVVDRFNVVDFNRLELPGRLAEVERGFKAVSAAVEVGDLPSAVLAAERTKFALDRVTGALGRYGTLEIAAGERLVEALDIVRSACTVSVMAFGGAAAEAILIGGELGIDVIAALHDARDGKPVDMKALAAKVGMAALTALLNKFGMRAPPWLAEMIVKNPAFLQTLSSVTIRMAQGKCDGSTALAEIVLAAVGGKLTGRLTGWLGKAIPGAPSHLLATVAVKSLTHALVAAPTALRTAFEKANDLDGFATALWHEALPDIALAVYSQLPYDIAQGIARERHAVLAARQAREAQAGAGGADEDPVRKVRQAYHELGFDPDHPPDMMIAKRTYRKIAFDNHPDKWQGAKPAEQAEAATLFMKAAAAIAVLEKTNQGGPTWGSSPAANPNTHDAPSPGAFANGAPGPSAQPGQGAAAPKQPLALPPHQEQPVAAAPPAEHTPPTAPGKQGPQVAPMMTAFTVQRTGQIRGLDLRPGGAANTTDGSNPNTQAIPLAAGAERYPPRQPQGPIVHLVQNGAGGPQQPAGTPHEPARAIAASGEHNGGSVPIGGNPPVPAPAQPEAARPSQAPATPAVVPPTSPAQAALAAMEAEVDAETARELRELEARPMNSSQSPEIRLVQKDADSARILFNSADTKAKKLAVLAKTHPSLSAKATIAAEQAKRDYQTYQVKNSSLVVLAAEATYGQLLQKENALWDNVEAQIGSKLIRGFHVPKAVEFDAEWTSIRDSLRGASKATAAARVRLEMATKARIEAVAQTGQKSNNLSLPPLYPYPRQAFVTAEEQEKWARSALGAAIKNYQQAEKLYRDRSKAYSAVEYLEQGDEHPEVARLAKERLLQAGEDRERARAWMEQGWETLKTATHKTLALQYHVMMSEALSGPTRLR